MAQSSPYDFDIYQPRNPKASAYINSGNSGHNSGNSDNSGDSLLIFFRHRFLENSKLEKDFQAAFAYATGLVEEEQIFPVQVSA